MNALAGFAATLGQAAGLHGLGAAELLQMLGHFMVLSMLAVGGAITTAPDMNRWLVQQQGWLTDAQFTASVALAQAAPGPNILFVALLGWNVGLNAGLGHLGVPLAQEPGIAVARIPAGTLYE